MSIYRYILINDYEEVLADGNFIYDLIERLEYYHNEFFDGKIDTSDIPRFNSGEYDPEGLHRARLEYVNSQIDNGSLFIFEKTTIAKMEKSDE